MISKLTWCWNACISFSCFHTLFITALCSLFKHRYKGGFEAEKKEPALTAKVSSLPGVQSTEQDDLGLHYSFFFGCPTTVLVYLILLLGNKSMWNYYAAVYLSDGCEFLIQIFNLPTILLCHMFCAFWCRYWWHCGWMLCLFDCPLCWHVEAKWYWGLWDLKPALWVGCSCSWDSWGV